MSSNWRPANCINHSQSMSNSYDLAFILQHLNVTASIRDLIWLDALRCCCCCCFCRSGPTYDRINHISLINVNHLHEYYRARRHRLALVLQHYYRVWIADHCKSYWANEKENGHFCGSIAVYVYVCGDIFVHSQQPIVYMRSHSRIHNKTQIHV